SWKKQGVHHEGIGGEGQAVGTEEQSGAVVPRIIFGAVAGKKDLLDEHGHLPASGAVAEKDPFQRFAVFFSGLSGHDSQPLFRFPFSVWVKGALILPLTFTENREQKTDPF